MFILQHQQAAVIYREHNSAMWDHNKMHMHTYCGTNS